jgi:RecJ-like exonuclease
MLQINLRKDLKKFSLLLSILLTLAIVLISLLSEPKTTLIENINKKQLDNYVKLNGTIINIENIKSSDYSFYILRLKDSSDSIDLISNTCNLDINQKVEVIGKISEYKNTLQIEVKKIKQVDVS